MSLRALGGNRMKNRISRRSFLAAAAVSAATLAVSGCDAKKSKKEVTDITVWNYYNGDQLECFNRLVSTFNETIGKEKGIRVSGSSQGTVNDLEANVMDAAEGKVGSAEMPTIFAAYADTAYKLDQMGMVVDLKDYLTEDEKAAFVPGYITEGDFDGSGSIKIFPVAKSTELMFFNDTDWQRFAKDTLVRYGALSTIEGVTAVAEQYYNWSGGKALFGRDALANYMLVGAKQLGCEIFEVRNGKMTLHFDHDVVRKLWDNYYVPFVKGHFAANGRFRSDDVKTGALLGCVGSCASATFFPKQVMPGDNQIHDIEMKVLPAPRFAGSEKVAVQQGAGMVTTAANDMDVIRASGLELTDTMEQVLSGAVRAVCKNELYTPTAFAGSNTARKILEYGMGDLASADRDTVLARIAAGQSAEAAVAEFLTDDYFEKWYQATLAQLQQYEG